MKHDDESLGVLWREKLLDRQRPLRDAYIAELSDKIGMVARIATEYDQQPSIAVISADKLADPVCLQSRKKVDVPFVLSHTTAI